MSVASYTTRKIDLYIANERSRITHVIEVKTDQSTTSLYQAVGQVMLHSSLEHSAPDRFIMLPGDVTPDTSARLERLGIFVLRYDWDGTQRCFGDLRQLCRA